MDVIDRINLCLSQIGKNGAEMSRELGLSNSIYSQWNTKKTKPSKKNLSRIADYLGVTVEYLLSGDESAKEKADPTKGTGLSLAKKKLIAAIDELSDEQCEKLFGIIEEAKKLL